MFFAFHDEAVSPVTKRPRGWRVKVDYTATGGAVLDICGAVNEAVARATAAAMNEARL